MNSTVNGLFLEILSKIGPGSQLADASAFQGCKNPIYFTQT